MKKKNNMELNYKKLVLDYLNTSIEHDDPNKSEFKVYSESTADGYEVYVATHDDRNVDINEDVYYYDSDLADIIMEQLEDHYSVYIDSYLYDDIYMDDKFEEYFDENVEDIVDYIPESFTKEELIFVKREYDLEIEE
jgi:hypothetical protein